MLSKFLKLFPWFITIAVIAWFVWKPNPVESTEVNTKVIVDAVVGLGKMELTKFHMQEIVEIKDRKTFAAFFKSESKVVLIASGEAVGCIDLTKITFQDIQRADSTLFVNLPPPEICYSKVNMEESHVYDMKVGVMGNPAKLVDKVYKLAERQIIQTALRKGILKETKASADVYLKEFLENITGMKVVLTYRMRGSVLEGP